ncbi:MAG: DUF1573 domain-containing protein [Microscillaceae bacterium]|nr:DUF1573 domain-containing protein [Microscillaceae bacterium]MDW8460818.1 DUF1573 domain-containing protein [Cytophagales bacterium]
MKKVFFVFFVMAWLSACDKGTKTETSQEQSSEKTDNQAVMQSNTAMSEQTSASKNENEKQLPVFKFEKTKHDFGEIRDGEVVKHTFTFTNVGNAPLIIKEARATCGCTVPNYPKEPIPPNGKGEITVEFNSTGKSGIQNKTITITANTNPEITTLEIQANVNSLSTMNGPIRK